MPWASLLFFKGKELEQNIPKVSPLEETTWLWAKGFQRWLQNCTSRCKPEGKENVPFRVGGGDVTSLWDCHSDNLQMCVKRDSFDGCLSRGNRCLSRGMRREDKEGMGWQTVGIRIEAPWESKSDHKKHNHWHLKWRDWQRGTFCSHLSKTLPIRKFGPKWMLESYSVYLILVSGSSGL